MNSIFEHEHELGIMRECREEFCSGRGPVVLVDLRLDIAHQSDQAVDHLDKNAVVRIINVKGRSVAKIRKRSM
jgi:hypothetical protein